MRRNPQFSANDNNRQWRLPNTRSFGNTQFRAPLNPNRPNRLWGHPQTTGPTYNYQCNAHALTFMVDTRNQITIISSICPKLMGINVDVQRVNNRTRAPRETIENLFYDKLPSQF
jgi:hypothetical protein